MAQKSILSFFKHADKTNGIAVKKSESTKTDPNILNTSSSSDIKSEPCAERSETFEKNSPLKKSSKRKRIQIVESEDDSDEVDETKKSLNTNGNEKMEVENSNTAVSLGDEDNSDTSKLDAKSDSQKSTENGETSEKCAKRKKPSIEDEKRLDEKTVKKVETGTSSVTPEEPECSKESSSVDKKVKSPNSEASTEFIPKRKTARKQMKSSVAVKIPVVTKKESCQETEKISNSSEDKIDSSPLTESSKSECTKETENGISSAIKSSKSPEKVKDTSKSPENSKDTSQSPEKVKSEEKVAARISKSSSADSDAGSSKVPKKGKNPPKKMHPFFGGQKKDNTSSTAQNEKSMEKETSNVVEKDTILKKDETQNLHKEKSSKKDMTTCSSSSGTTYDPSKSRYDPISDACWKRDEKVPYLALAKTMELIESISARLKIIEILSNFLRSVITLSPEDLLHSVYLCLNRLAPEYEGIELGVGETLLMKAVAQATGRTLGQVKAEVAEKGDLGLVAESSRGHQRLMFAPPKLSIDSVFSKFKEIAMMTGNSAMAKKTDKIQALFVACRDCEAKYIIRSLSGKLRIGLAEQSVLAAISRAAVLTPPTQPYPPPIMDSSSGMNAEAFKKHLDAQTLILKTTYCECPNYDLLIPVLLKEGIPGLPAHCQLTPGRPLKPMLAHPTTGIDEVLRRFDNNEFTCEYKYDGERAQIHMTENGEVSIYSRNQEENTSKYPDVIGRISKAQNDTTKSFILDTEAVAWDCESKQILPFQILSTRKKKDAVEADIVVQVCVMAFDLLYFNGESLVKKPLKERRALLHSSFKEIPNEFMFVTYRDGNSAETMQEFLDESVKGNCEGLMVKALETDASYEIAKRSHNWLKLKKDYLNGIGDTLDLVVIGGYHGKGKRTGTYGGFLLACYDDENEEFQSICKLGTGFKDADLEAHTKFFKDHVIETPKSYYRFDLSLQPDVWFEPVQVWEIKCADLSVSPVHKAAIGIVDPEKGISLRFPRFLRIRDDKKKPEDATVSSQIAVLYQKQEQVQNMKNKNVKAEEDYY